MANSGKLLNYTTSVEVSKTSGEIMGILQAHGVRRINTTFDVDGNITGLEFGMTIQDQDIGYRLPVNTAAVMSKLEADYAKRLIERRYVSIPQAQRVAWRIIKDWIEAQLAIIATGMVQVQEVFLPYMLLPDNKTIFETMQERVLLTAGKGD